MDLAANRTTLTVLTVANLVCCPLYLALWLFSAAAVGGHPTQAWQSWFLGGFLLLSGACLLLPVLAWSLQGRRPRAALIVMIAPLAPVVSSLALMKVLSAVSILAMIHPR